MHIETHHPHPLVTIGLPVYNGAASLSRALDSLLSQTVREFRLVISDNCSTDLTGDICREYTAKDTRIRYVRQPRNIGAAMNFRYVLFQAETPYFMWAAADDVWAATFIEQNLDILERYPWVVLSQGKVLFTVNGKPSHLSTGTYALLKNQRENVARFFKNPADNSRYYGLFRTAALKSVFPSRVFHALDWAVSASTLRFGFHYEIQECLMAREVSDIGRYRRAVLEEHRFVLWRAFPGLFMTFYVLRKGRIPISSRILRNLLQLNLYLHFQVGAHKWQRLAEAYVSTASWKGVRRWIVQSIIDSSFVAVARKGLGTLTQELRHVWASVSFTRQMVKNVRKGMKRLPGAVVPGSSKLASVLQGKVKPHRQRRQRVWRFPTIEPAEKPTTTAILIVDRLLPALDLISAIVESHASSLEILVAATGPRDLTPAVLSRMPGVRLVELPEKMSFGKALFVAMSSARGEFLFVSDQHVDIAPDALPRLLRAMREAPTTGMAGPKVLYSGGRLRAAGGILGEDNEMRLYGESGDPANPRYCFARDVDFCPTAFLLRQEALDGFPAFARILLTADQTSAALAGDLRKDGWRVSYVPSAVVVSCAEQSHDAAPLAGEIPPAPHSGHPPDLAVAVHDRTREKRLLFVDAETPMPDRNSGSIDALNMMRIFDQLGFRVSFIPQTNLSYRSSYTASLQDLGIEALYHPYINSVRDALQANHDHFDVVVLCRATIAPNLINDVRSLCPRAKVVFDTVDLHFLRERRGAAFTGDALLLARAERTRLAELAAVAGSDATIVRSSVEEKIVKSECPTSTVCVIPLIREIPERLEAPGFDERRDVMFVGTYQHPPNEDAAIYLATEIWPRVCERLPDAGLLLVGSAVTETVKRLASDKIKVLGFVQDLDDLLAGVRLTVAPLRFGAGLKGKLASSLAAGVPSVATPIAAEGMALRNGNDILIADTPEALADAIVELYTSKDLWERVCRNGFEFARRELTMEANCRRIKHLLSTIGAQTLRGELELIDQELASADQVYQPSEFWRYLSTRNRRQLASGRLSNFKRTINNNYFQWLPADFEDVQVKNLLRFWSSHPSITPFEVVAGSSRETRLFAVEGFDGKNPFSKSFYVNFYAFFVGLLWHYVTTTTPLRIPKKLEEPSLGSPLPLRLNGRTISQDLANAIDEWSRIREIMAELQVSVPGHFLEVGAGYGRLAYVALNDAAHRYVIADISPALAIAKWYLNHLFPKKRIFSFRHFATFEEVQAEFELADICFITTNQLSMLPDRYFDITIAISTLHEMRREQIAHYKNLISSKTKGGIYMKNWKSWHNPTDDIVISRDDYAFSEEWEVLIDRNHPIQSDFSELAVVRSAARHATQQTRCLSGRYGPHTTIYNRGGCR